MAYKVTSALKEKHFPSLILLFGSEDYLKRQFKDKIIDTILPEKSSMNFSAFKNSSGKKEESEGFLPEILSLSSTTPFFSEKRVILCENTGYFKNKFDLIPKLFENLPDFTHIIFLEKEISRATTAFKYVSKNGFFEEYNMPEKKDLISWINGRVKKEGMSISRDALEDFISRTGINMDNMDKELSKLLTYTMGRETISQADIEAICTLSLEEQVFNIVNAIAKRDKRTALLEYSYLYHLRSNPRAILALLTSRFSLILNISQAKKAGMQNGEIASSLGIKNEYALKKNLETARLFSEKSLYSIINMSGEYQQKMNTGLLNEQTGLEMFLLNSLKA